ACMLLRQLEQALPRRGEHIDLLAGAVSGPCAVRYPRRNHRDVALAHRAHRPVQVNDKLAVQDDDDLLLLLYGPWRHRARREAHEVRHHSLAEHRPESEPRGELHCGQGGHVHIASWSLRLAERLGREMAGGVTHLSSSALFSTSPIRRMPSSMS